MLSRFPLPLLLLVLAACPHDGTAAPKPNIILIMADDLGYSDLGCYGSEISTPHLDRLAQGGLSFTQFYNNAKCAPSRASLLTGLYPQQTRDGGSPARSRNLAQVLNSAGYQTLMTGRSGGLAAPPASCGFDRFFGLLNGCCNYFNPGLQRPGEQEPGRKQPGEARAWARDNRIIQPFTPDDPKFYATDAFTETAVSYLDQFGRNDRPFFLYLPYTAPHFPIHARSEDIAKYRGKYLAGWDALRVQRCKRLRKLGLIDPGWKLSPRDPAVPPWNDLEDDAKQRWDLHMAVYAAMIDRMDQGIGRILARIRHLGIEENTLVFFLSDNGACAEDEAAFEATAPDVPPGPLESYRTQGVPWANASNTPFRKFKWWLHEGGIASPLIVSWPGVIQPGRVTAEVAHIMDLMPTCLEAAGIEYPPREAGPQRLPLEGRSLLPVLKGKSRSGERPLFWQFGLCRAVRQGDWKLVAGHPDPRLGIDFFKQDQPSHRNAKPGPHWELYNLRADRTECENLAAKFPDRVKTMAGLFDAWATRVNRGHQN